MIYSEMVGCIISSFITGFLGGIGTILVLQWISGDDGDDDHHKPA